MSKLPYVIICTVIQTFLTPSTSEQITLLQILHGSITAFCLCSHLVGHPRAVCELVHPLTSCSLAAVC